MRLIGYYALNGRKGDIDTKIERTPSRLGKCSRYINHHNPKKDIDRAIKPYRGLHSPMYVKEVKCKLKGII